MASENVCPVCQEAAELYCIDGFFYCSSCNTQSQQVREVNADVEETGFPVVHLQLAAPRKQHAILEKDNPSAQQELGPLVFYELLTVMLREQALRLETFGAPPSVKNCVFYLWTKFLKQRGVALFDVPHSNATIKLATSAFRRHCGHPNLKSWRRREAPSELNRRLPRPKTTSSVAKDEQGEDPPESLDELQTGVNGVVMNISPGHTISFCYLACLMCGVTAIHLSDILRWCKQECFPYFNVGHLLPERLQVPSMVALLDTAKRCQTTCGHFALSIRLAEYLDEPLLIADTGFLAFITRLVHDLNLPDAILDRISYLLSLRPPSTAFDVSYLLKQNLAHRQCSDIMQCYNNDRPYDEEAFVFSDWLLQCRWLSAILFDHMPVDVVLRKANWFGQRFQASVQVSQELRHATVEEQADLSADTLPGIFGAFVNSTDKRVSLEPSLLPLRAVVDKLKTSCPRDSLSSSELTAFDLMTKSFKGASLNFFGILQAAELLTAPPNTAPLSAGNSELLRLFPLLRRYSVLPEFPKNIRYGTKALFESYRAHVFPDTFDWLLHFFAAVVMDLPSNLLVCLQTIEATIVNICS